MKMIQAILRPSKMEKVKKALEDAGYTSLTTIEVKGRGRQKGITQIWRGEEYVVDMLPKVKLEVVVPDDKEEALRYFMWVMKWFFVSVSLRLCGLVSKLLNIKPTATEQNHRVTEAQR